MKALLQRVSRASVSVGGETVGRIGAGILVFLAVERGDGAAETARMARKIAGLRFFPDGAGRMNRCVLDAGGEVLAVPQFTLAANLSRGMRPSFEGAESPERASSLFGAFCRLLEERGIRVAQGRFGADMGVELLNDGPVTFWLDFPPAPP